MFLAILFRFITSNVLGNVNPISVSTFFQPLKKQQFLISVPIFREQWEIQFVDDVVTVAFEVVFELGPIGETIHAEIDFFTLRAENFGVFGDFFVAIVTMNLVGGVIDVLWVY